VSADTGAAAAAWDAEYRAGRYRDEPPVAFVGDIVAAARGLAGVGVYVGCGNGRNYVPLVDAGVDLIGLDISRVAIDQLAQRVPHRRLVHGGLDALPAGATYPIVVGIQVFQHGDRATTHTMLGQARERVAPGGLFCLRVNAVGTDLAHDHDVTEHHDDGGFTVRYRNGPKAGLLIHFFGHDELAELFARDFVPVLAPRVRRTPHTAPTPGQWSQWEAIWRKSSEPAESSRRPPTHERSPQGAHDQQPNATSGQPGTSPTAQTTGRRKPPG
jgi:SAM-dependent methyltransferase